MLCIQECFNPHLHLPSFRKNVSSSFALTGCRVAINILPYYQSPTLLGTYQTYAFMSYLMFFQIRLCISDVLPDMSVILTYFQNSHLSLWCSPRLSLPIWCSSRYIYVCSDAFPELLLCLFQCSSGYVSLFWCSPRTHPMFFRICLSLLMFFQNSVHVYLMLSRIWLYPSDAFPDMSIVLTVFQNLFPYI